MDENSTDISTLVVERLRRENAKLSRSIIDVERKTNQVEFEYRKLAKSKLGRLTLWFWRHKDALKKRLGKMPPAVPAPVPAAVSAPSRGDEGFFARMSEKIQGMPESNGSRYFRKLDARIGVICDQFYYDSVKDAADFVYLSPDVDEATLASLDCLLMVTAWSGLKDQEWQDLATEDSPTRQAAERIIGFCRGRRIPTVFYSKEDPPNYESFVGLAQQCDHVFTSAAECIPDYRRDCGHDRVRAMNFCINPKVHNPVGSRYRDKERRVLFSGSWMKKYPQRCQDLATILDGVLAAGRELNIVDRNYELRDNSQFAFPERFRCFQSPAIDHANLQRIHRLYDWAVNINTVKDSATMFANRVYELQACGNLLLSNYSYGVSNLFPGVLVVRDVAEVPKFLNGLTPEEVYERQMAGVRRVMTGETCFDRVAEMLNLVGIPCPPLERRVLVVAKTLTDSVRGMFERQTCRNKILMAEDEVTDRDYGQADLVAFFDESVHYGAYYLEDMANAFKYTDSDYVTKDAYLDAGQLHAGVEHDYVERMPGKFRTVFWRAAFTWEQLRTIKAGPLPHGYAVDHLGCEVHRAASTAEEPVLAIPPVRIPSPSPAFAQGTRMKLLDVESPLTVPPKGEFVSKECDLAEDFVRVSVSGRIAAEGIPEPRKKALVMVVKFLGGEGELLKSGALSVSPRWGVEYAYLTAGGDRPRFFMRYIPVPQGAKRLVVQFTKELDGAKSAIQGLKVSASKM